jgi:hypothetical protein
MTVRELLARIDSRELSEWMAYFSLEPWGTEVEDWRAGMIAGTIANVNRDPKKRRRPFEPKDFMPQRVPESKEEQSWEDQAKILEMWFGMHTARGGQK